MSGKSLSGSQRPAQKQMPEDMKKSGKIKK